MQLAQLLGTMSLVGTADIVSCMLHMTHSLLHGKTLTSLSRVWRKVRKELTPAQITTGTPDASMSDSSDSEDLIHRVSRATDLHSFLF